MNIQFFWEKKNKKGGTRSRFNLLLLEYGEYYLEDFSAYQFGLGAGETINEDLKIQGRLKMSSRSLVFEPNEVRYPLLRFPFKNMQTDLVEIKAGRLGMSLQLTGIFTFSCTQYFEMKAHNKIGPFKIVELPRPSTPSDSTLPDANAFRFVFALVHSRLDDLQLKVEQFRHIVKISDRMGSIVANQHLRPFIEHALISTFDSSNLVDFHEKYLLNSPLTTRKILPLISHPGSLMITESRLYFQPAQLNNIGDASQKFELRKVSRIYKRRYLLRPTGLEFFLEDGSSHLFVFESRDERDHVYELVNTKSAYSRRPIVTLDELTRKWQRREISNFQYLMHLNNEAGRTTNDLTQYPVFPHILSDYRSKKLNIESSLSYRDLSKPVGALNRDRLEFFRERFESMPPADPSLGLPPPFLYGTHYSTPGYVLFYLVRVAPEYMLCLQNGRFDAPDRMFHSVADMWESCLNNPADLKELIPEFFTGTGEFLSNADDLDLGHRSSGERLHDVVLPPWADSTRDFIRKHAKALESEYVSDHLHEWIDLIFGFKQQGEEAVNADNLFYYLTYEKAVDLDAIKDPRERAAIENQIQEFGQTPSQLFAAAHPRRNDLSAPIVTTAASAASVTAMERTNAPPSPSSSDVNLTASASTVSAPAPAPATGSSSQKLRPGSWNNLLRGSGSNKSPSAPSTFSQLSSGTNAPAGIGGVSSLSSAFSSMLQPRPTASVNRLINNSTSPVPANRPDTPIMAGGNILSPVARTGNSTVPSVATVPGSYNGDPATLPDDDVPIIHLGDDFRQAVESLDGNDEEESDDIERRNHRQSQLLPLKSGKPEELGILSDTDELVDVDNRDNGAMFIDCTKLRLFPSELFYWHTKSVTDIALRITRCDIPSAGSDSEDVIGGGMNSQMYLPFSGRRKLNAVLATVSKDSLLKIVRIEQDLDMSQMFHNNASMTAGAVSRTQCTISRSFSASGSSLSSCALTQDALKVILGSWDNHIYGYNISSATPAGKKFGHYDSVTCLALDEQ
jgi:factor associated with neutral sphingomyelinase activation